MDLQAEAHHRAAEFFDERDEHGKAVVGGRWPVDGRADRLGVVVIMSYSERGLAGS